MCLHSIIFVFWNLFFKLFESSWNSFILLHTVQSLHVPATEFAHLYIKTSFTEKQLIKYYI
jgi:hypothetical protein